MTVFETGSNQWKNYDVWPPKNSQPETFYFQSKGKLSAKKPKAAKAVTEYDSDPAKPVPYTNEISGDRNNKYMAEDQRFASRRPDVIFFQTDSLTSDLTLTGEITANLFVSMTGTDADFVVKVIDVWPDSIACASAARTTKTIGYERLPANGSCRSVPWKIP